MSDLFNDGMTKVVLVPAADVVDISSPTIAELTAVGMLELQTRITPDGYKNDVSEAKIDTSSLASTSNTSVPGRVDYDASLTLKRGTAVNEKAWELALTRLSEWVMFVRSDMHHSEEFAAAQFVEAYPVTVGSWQPQAKAANEVQKVLVPLYVTLAADDQEPRTLANPATVAAA